MLTTHRMQEIFREGSYGARLMVAHSIILNLDEHLPWLAARQLDGLSLTRQDEGWLIVLRARKRNQRQVAFFAGADPEDVVMIMTHALIFDLASWKTDKYRSMRSD